MPQWDPQKVDRLEPIGDDETVEMTLRLSHEEGIFAGISTGANVVARIVSPSASARTRSS
jgi:cysteine synthase A